MSSPMLLPENAVTVVRGASKTLALTVTRADTGKSVDLTGCTVYFTVKARVEDQVPLILKTSNNPAEIDIVSPRAGQAQIYLEPIDTKNRPAPCEYLFDVWVVLTTGARYPVVKTSVFQIEPGVTVLQ